MTQMLTKSVQKDRMHVQNFQERKFPRMKKTMLKRRRGKGALGVGDGWSGVSLSVLVYSEPYITSNYYPIHTIAKVPRKNASKQPALQRALSSSQSPSLHTCLWKVKLIWDSWRSLQIVTYLQLVSIYCKMVMQ